ncbi:hypothetical protein DSECCO2_551490 [anaerobic digester metagenome]|jgi:hypothetical protein
MSPSLIFSVRPIPASPMPGGAPGTNRYEKTGFVKPLPRLFLAIATPGHDGSPDAHLTVLEGHFQRSILLRT